MTTIQIDIHNLAATYGARHVFADVNLTLHQGEILVVAGHNGSGKSTLLRLLSGLQRPTQGQIIYHINNTRFSAEAAQSYVGWVAPDLQLYRELTALENLRFFAQVRGIQRSQADLEALLERVELRGRGHDLVGAYSSGMTQRLRYAFALLHDPAILLLDEPTATLDVQGADLVERIVQEQRNKCIIVVATNDPRELRWGDYILRLDADN
jgi:heme exporter protein A